MSISKLGRKKEHRERTLRNVATSLVLYEKIATTDAKARAVIPMVERLIIRAADGSLESRRYAMSLLFDSNAVRKLFEDLPARQGDRQSGFVRSTKLPPRHGDQAAMVQLELLFTPLEEVLEKNKQTKVKVRKKASEPSSESTEETTS